MGNCKSDTRGLMSAGKSRCFGVPATGQRGKGAVLKVAIKDVKVSWSIKQSGKGVLKDLIELQQKKK